MNNYKQDLMFRIWLLKCVVYKQKKEFLYDISCHQKGYEIIKLSDLRIFISSQNFPGTLITLKAAIFLHSLFVSDASATLHLI